MGRVSRDIKGIPTPIDYKSENTAYLLSNMFPNPLSLRLCRFAIILSRTYIFVRKICLLAVLYCYCAREQPPESTKFSIHWPLPPHIRTRSAHEHAFEKQKMRKTKT